MNEQITLEEIAALSILEALISSSYGKGVRKGFIIGLAASVSGMLIVSILGKRSKRKK